MNKFRMITPFCSCLVLAVCFNASAAGKKGDAKTAAKKAVLETLKDRDSAKFGKFTLVKKDNACFTVNARNSFGGYTGDKEAFLTKIKNKWMVLDYYEVSHETCIKMLSKLNETDKTKDETESDSK